MPHEVVEYRYNTIEKHSAVKNGVHSFPSLYLTWGTEILRRSSLIRTTAQGDRGRCSNGALSPVPP